MNFLNLLSMDGDETAFWGRTEALLSVLRLAGHRFDAAVYKDTHSWSAATGIEVDDLNKWFAGFATSQWCPILMATPGAREFLQKLCPCGGVPLITACAVDVRKRTMREVTGLFGELLIEGRFGCAERKGEVIQELQVAIHIDDSLHEARAIVRSNPFCYVIHIPNYIYGNDSRLIGHDRIIPLRSSLQVQAGMAAKDRECVFKEIWLEAEQRVLELAYDKFPYLVEDRYSKRMLA